MKERPILFSAPMVRAILEGRKTQTRRIVKHIPALGGPLGWCAAAKAQEPGWVYIVGDYRRFCPYGVPGDRLWVKETWCAWDTTEENIECDEVEGNVASLVERGIGRHHVTYRADPNRYANKWRPSIFMPRWASRITLEIEAVRVERLIEISEEDAVAEGVIAPRCEHCGYTRADSRFQMDHRFCQSPEPSSAIPIYRELWESINGFGAWDANPWVWVIQFRRIKP